MARIRTIKPEFPQSESIGRLSRDARLLFIMLWTICDDEGRTRAPSRMLASLLFPYDDDAASMIDGWLGELEAEGCVRRYEVDGSTYLDIPNWHRHQKVDKPSASKIPQFREHSRNLAKHREPSSGDLGPRTMDLGPRKGSESVPSQQQQHVTQSERDATAAAAAAPPAGSDLDPKTIERRCREAAGYQTSPDPNLFVVGPIVDLLVDGFDLETDVLPVIRAKAEAMRAAGANPARSWIYFAPAIREAKVRRLAAAAAPVGTPHQPFKSKAMQQADQIRAELERRKAKKDPT